LSGTFWRPAPYIDYAMSTHPIFRSGKLPLVLGHRGVPRQHQENSLAGFRKARELGLDGVELDVFVTRDQRVVVFHDEATERLTGVRGNICDMSWDEVSKLRLQTCVDMGGSRQRFAREERIPLLEEVLDELQDKLLINIELKAYGVCWSRRHTGTLVGKILRERRAEQCVIATSFDPLMLLALQTENPDVHMGFAWDDDMFGGLARLSHGLRARLSGRRVGEGPDPFVQQTLPNWLMERLMGKLLDARVVGMEQSLIDGDSIAKARAGKLATGAYTLFPLDVRNARALATTAQHERQLGQLLKYGIDWIETDDGPKVLELLARAPRSSGHASSPGS